LFVLYSCLFVCFSKKKNRTHVPYRDSKLTRMLQPSLSGKI